VGQSRDIHIRIQKFLGQLATEPSISLPSETSPQTLAERTGSLMSYRSQLEDELDRLQERLAQISRDKQDKSRQAAKETLRSTANDLYQAVAELEGIRNQMGNTSESRKLEQVLARISQSMNRCNQATPENGPALDTGLPWRKGSEEETIVLRIAAKQRDLREVSRKIAETQRAMTGSETVAPLLSRAQWTARRHDQAIAQLNLLEDRIARLRPSTVTVLGGTD
jgi:DNA-binding transcriptional MerR regulator